MSKDGYRWSIVPKKHRQILLLLRAGVGIKTISQLVGVGVKTVQRRKAILDAKLNAKVDASIENLEVKFRDNSNDCPVHGRVTVWPCVACAALAKKKSK